MDEEEEKITDEICRVWEKEKIAAICKMKRAAKWYDQRAEIVMRKAESCKEKVKRNRMQNEVRGVREIGSRIDNKKANPRT